jgi:DNA-3-methyladenine glycosylase
MFKHMPKLNRSFFDRQTLVVARELLGKKLIHNAKEGLAVGEIVETEAYIGPEDRASHAYGGRRTARVEVQYGPAGHVYVYSIHRGFCFNVTTGRLGSPEVVLIRALRPLYGIRQMAKRRKIKLRDPPQREVVSLCNGPSKLCEALGINKRHNGHDLCSKTLYLEDSGELPPSRVTRTPRIRIDYAGEARNYPWRFCVVNCPYVSRPILTSTNNKSHTHQYSKRQR